MPEGMPDYIKKISICNQEIECKSSFNFYLCATELVEYNSIIQNLIHGQAIVSKASNPTEFFESEL
jgi:hypothetical protein